MAHCVSNSKLTKLLVSVSAVLGVCLWIAGCSPKEEDDSGGQLTKGGGSGYANAAVTAQNLDDFIDVFRSALNSYYRDDRSQNGVGSKHYIGAYTANVPGDSSGYAESYGSSAGSEYNRKREGQIL